MEITGSYKNYANSGSTGMSQGRDSVSKSIQNQIVMKQQEMQKLSENKELSPEEKMKKRQEINQEISNLNMQLRQHQMEKRREQTQKAENSMKDLLGGQKESADQMKNKENSGFSQGSMQALISADTAISQAKMQRSVTTKLEGAARTLGGEIKQDAARGVSTEEKEKQLAKMEQRVMQAGSSQTNTLKEAEEELKEAAKEEKGTAAEETESGSAEEAEKRAFYRPVDIRL